MKKDIMSRAWIRQPLSLLCKQGGLTKHSAIVLALIIDRATDTTPPEPVTMSHAELAELSGYSTRQVRRAIAELIAAELIASTRTGRSSLYTLTGAVELLPPKRQRGGAAEPRPHRRRSNSSTTASMTAREIEEMEGYLSVVNRFSEDTSYALDVCQQAAQEGDPDYEL